MNQLTHVRGLYADPTNPEAVLHATHVDIVMRHRNGQEWRLVEQMAKGAGVTAANAIFDTLTLTGKTGEFTVHVRYYTPEGC